MVTRNPNTARHPGSPEHGREIFNVEQKLRREITPALSKLNELKRTASPAEATRINRAIISMEGAMQRTERAGANIGKYKVAVENKTGGHAYDQFEGIPVDDAIEILSAAESALPANSPQKAELQKIVGKLKQNSAEYFQAHYNKNNADVISNRTPLSPEEAKKQDLRVRTEAKLIAGDDERKSRKANDYDRLEEDYQHGKKDLDKRREWKFNPVELPTTIAVVEASDSAEVLAKMRAEEEMTKRMTQGNFLKKWWNRAFEEGKKQTIYEEELRKISGHSKKPGWFARKILRRKADADDEQNMFREKDAGGDKSKAELEALATRFAQENLRKAEGEKSRQINDPQFNGRINDLVHEYATGQMTDAEFEDRKTTLVTDIKKKYPGDFKKGILTADNILEAARVFRKSVEHGANLARTDVQLQVILGEARSRIKSEENLSWTEGIIKTINKNALGKYVSPATIGYAMSAANYFFKKPIFLFGGAILGGSFFGAFRRSKQVRQDIAMHRRERETGFTDMPDTATAKRREKVEKFVNNMEKASDILARIQAARSAYETNSTPENRAVLVAELGNAEARMSLAATRKRGLIEYDGEMGIERTAMEMMKEMSEAKILAGVTDLNQTAEYKNAMKGLVKDVDKKDKDADKYRRFEMFKAALVGAATGGIAGVLAQEMTDEAGEALIRKFGHSKVWDWMDRPAGSTQLQHLKSYLQSKKLPGQGEWWDWANPNYKGCAGGTHFGDVKDVTSLFPGQHSIKIDKSLDLVPDKTVAGLFHLKDHASGQVLQDFSIHGGKLAPVGTLNSELELNAIPFKVSGGGGPTSGEHFKIHTKGFYENSTFMHTDPATGKLVGADENELKFHINYDSTGNIHLKAPLEQYGSWHAAAEGMPPAGAPGSSMEYPDVHKLLKDGDLKFILIPKPGAEPVVLDINPSTGEAVIVPGSYESQFFDPVTHKCLADTYGTARVDVTGTYKLSDGSDGKEIDLYWLNSDRGQGVDVTQAGGKEWQEYEIFRRFNDAQCAPDSTWDPPMFVPFYRRKALEARGQAGEAGTEQAGQTDETAAPVRQTPEQIAAMTPEQRATSAEAEIMHGLGQRQVLTEEHFNEIVTAHQLTPEQRVAVLQNVLTHKGVGYEQELAAAKAAQEQISAAEVAAGRPAIPFNQDMKEKFLLQHLQNVLAAHRPVTTARTGEAPNGDDVDHGEGPDDDGEPTTRTTRETPEQMRERKELVQRAKSAVKEFNRHGANKFPHVRIEFDNFILESKPRDVIERVTEVQEKLDDAMEELRNDRKYRTRNFVFRFKLGESTRPEITENETEVLNFTLNQEAGEIVPIFRRFLEGGFDRTKAAAGAGGARTETRAANTEAPRAAAETDRQKADKIFAKLVNDTGHKVHWVSEGTMLSDADQFKVMTAFSEVWESLAQDKKDPLLARNNPHRPGDTGIVFKLVAGKRGIGFDPATDCLYIGPDANKTTIKAFLENPAAAPAAPARPAAARRPAAAGGH